MSNIRGTDQRRSKDELWRSATHYQESEGPNAKRVDARGNFETAVLMIERLEGQDLSEVDRRRANETLESCLGEIAKKGLQDNLTHEGTYGTRLSDEQIQDIIGRKEAWIQDNYE